MLLSLHKFLCQRAHVHQNVWFYIKSVWSGTERTAKFQTFDLKLKIRASRAYDLTEDKSLKGIRFDRR